MFILIRVALLIANAYGFAITVEKLIAAANAAIDLGERLWEKMRALFSTNSQVALA